METFHTDMSDWFYNNASISGSVVCEWHIIKIKYKNEQFNIMCIKFCWETTLLPLIVKLLLTFNWDCKLVFYCHSYHLYSNRLRWMRSPFDSYSFSTQANLILTTAGIWMKQLLVETLFVLTPKCVGLWVEKHKSVLSLSVHPIVWHFVAVSLNSR